jgi:hypothetical protein
MHAAIARCFTELNAHCMGTLRSCAQIVVPVDLADVLKAFTKEVIRRQPQDLVAFGAK